MFTLSCAAKFQAQYQQHIDGGLSVRAVAAMLRQQLPRRTAGMPKPVALSQCLRILGADPLALGPLMAYSSLRRWAGMDGETPCKA